MNIEQPEVTTSIENRMELGDVVRRIRKFTDGDEWWLALCWLNGAERGVDDQGCSIPVVLSVEAALLIRDLLRRFAAQLAGTDGLNARGFRAGVRARLAESESP